MFKILAQLGPTQEKTSHAAEQGRLDGAAARAEWRERQLRLAADTLIFLEETWTITTTTTTMCRRYGQACRGECLMQAAAQCHWHVSTLIGASRHDGLVASCVVDGAIDGDLFVDSVEQQLAPVLRPDDVVVMHTLGSHKVGVRKAIADTGAELLHLPPCIPDLNPIERAFAKLKPLLRARAQRSMDGPWSALGPFSNAFSQAECLNYFHYSGYRQSA